MHTWHMCVQGLRGWAWLTLFLWVVSWSIILWDVHTYGVMYDGIYMQDGLAFPQLAPPFLLGFRRPPSSCSVRAPDSIFVGAGRAIFKSYTCSLQCTTVQPYSRTTDLAPDLHTCYLSVRSRYGHIQYVKCTVVQYLKYAYREARGEGERITRQGNFTSLHFTSLHFTTVP